MTGQQPLGWTPKGAGWERTFETFRAEVEPNSWGIWAWRVGVLDEPGEDAEGAVATPERAMELSEQVGQLLHPCGPECSVCRRPG